MFRILVVCMGNICRSPMAAERDAGRCAAAWPRACVQVDSAGTYAGHIRAKSGSQRAIQVAKSRGVRADRETSGRGVCSEEDFERFDLILVMDRLEHGPHLRRLCMPARNISTSCTCFWSTQASRACARCRTLTAAMRRTLSKCSRLCEQVQRRRAQPRGDCAALSVEKSAGLGTQASAFEHAQSFCQITFLPEASQAS